MMMILSITDGHDQDDGNDNDDDTRSTIQEPLQVLHQEGRRGERR